MIREKAIRTWSLVNFLSWAGVLAALYWSSLYSYLLFHSLAELFSVIIACCLFVIAWNSRRILENNYLLFLGIAYLFVGAIDLVHTLGYKGMGVFPGYDANLSTQLWIGARFLEAVSLALAPLWFQRRLRPHLVLAAYGAVVVLLFLAIFHWQIFPACYVEGVGLTPFKKVSEYIICLILLAALGLLLSHRREFDPTVLRLIMASIVLTIGSELAFTFYVSVYGLSNLIGHFLKIVSFYLIYKAIIETGLVKPYNLLFRNLKRREDELAQHVIQLEAANEEMEAFSYSVSHDLRAPLRAMGGFSRLLLEDHAPRLDAEGLRLLGIIVDSVKKMQEMIDSLLALSRLGRQEMRLAEVDMERLAKEVMEELRGLSPQRQVEFIVRSLPPSRGDRGMLYQALANLLGNALKFTSLKGRAVIEVGGESQDRENLYYVKDNGIGFEPEHADKLFRAFQRLHRDSQFEGTGLGLAIVQRVVARHGGRVWAESQVRAGATFFFTLPKSEVNGGQKP